MFIGLFFFFFGALYVRPRFFAVTPAIVLEGRGSGRRSRDRLDAVATGASGTSSTRSASRPSSTGCSAFGIAARRALLGNLVVQALIGAAIFTIMVYPVVAITEALLYYDTRIKSEGLDIELMAGALEGAPSREAAAP